jgi:hypothetical protein
VFFKKSKLIGHLWFAMCLAGAGIFFNNSKSKLCTMASELIQKKIANIALLKGQSHEKVGEIRA